MKKKISCLLIVCSLLVCLCALTAGCMQSLVYPGADADIPDYRYGYPAEQIKMKAEDGTMLGGWFFNRGSNSPLVVCYGGNAMNVGAFNDMAKADTARSYLLINYRGYGNSEGEPAEADIVNDARHCLREARRMLGAPSAVTLVGFSLGSGVATQVAASEKPDALILICPFDSITEVACNIVPFIPRLLSLDSWKSVDYAPQITCPVTIIRASHDSVVPSASTDALIRAFTATKPSVHAFPCDHNGIFATDGFVKTLMQCLP